jgi:hypothetical protein
MMEDPKRTNRFMEAKITYKTLVFGYFTKVLRIIYTYLLLKCSRIVDGGYLYFIVSPNQFKS